MDQNALRATCFSLKICLTHNSTLFGLKNKNLKKKEQSSSTTEYETIQRLGMKQV